MAKRGRKPIQIDTTILTKLAQIHVPREDMAFILGVSVDTLDRNFAEVIDKGLAEGRKELRTKLWQLARKGNLGALIWLSKQHLGMTEKADHTLTNKAQTIVKVGWGDEPEQIPEVAELGE